MNLTKYRSDLELRKEIVAKLPKGFLDRHPERLWIVALLYGAILLNVMVCNFCFSNPGFWWLAFVSGIILVNIGTAGPFIMHEIQHDAVIKNKSLKWFFSVITGVVSLITPHLWRKWHNWHHRYTAEALDVDRVVHPDFDDSTQLSTRIYGKFWRFSFQEPFTYMVAPFLGLWFQHYIQGVLCLFELNKYKIKRSIFIVETVLILTIAISPMHFLGKELAIISIYIPLVFSNLIANIYICSNHSGNPLNVKNTTLLNSTSVYLFKNISHYSFGRHVEHHLFPSIVHSKLSPITNFLRENYSDSFKERHVFKVIFDTYNNPKTHLPEIIDT